MKKAQYIVVNAIPVLVMIALIPIISNDYLLALADVIIILVALKIKYEEKEWTVLLLGFLIMIASESIFISTGVETFIRHSMFGIMPLWLPFLWAYGFVAIKRSVEALKQ